MKRVVVAIIPKIDNEGKSRYLLISSTKDFGKYTGFLYPPGGHIEKKESKEQALIREVKEELGVDVVPIRQIAQSESDVSGQITYWYRCEPLETEEFVVQNDEITYPQWLTLDEIANLDHVWPATKRFFSKYF